MGAHPYPFPRVIHNPSIKGTGSWPHCCHHMREEDPERGNSIFFFLGGKDPRKGMMINTISWKSKQRQKCSSTTLPSPSSPPWFHLSQYRRRDDPRMNGVSPPLCFRPFIAVFVKRINGRKLSLLKVCTPRQPLDRRT